jgi:hypothetical protein
MGGGLRLVFQLGIPCRGLVTNPREKYSLMKVKETAIKFHTIEHVLWSNQSKNIEENKMKVCDIVIFIRVLFMPAELIILRW